MKYFRNKFHSREDFILNRVKGKKVLDLGCIDHDLSSRNTGQWLHEHIRKQAAYVLGLDNESKYILQLQQEGYNVQYADVSNYDLHKTFDIIIAGELIEHLPNPGSFLQCTKMHMRPDSLLILTTHNALSFSYFVQNLLLGKLPENPTHCACYSISNLERLLAMYDFTIVETCFSPRGDARLLLKGSLINRLSFLFRYTVQLLLGYLRPSIQDVISITAKKTTKRE